MKVLYSIAIITELILFMFNTQSIADFKLGVILYTLIYIAYILDENNNLKKQKK